MTYNFPYNGAEYIDFLWLLSLTQGKIISTTVGQYLSGDLDVFLHVTLLLNMETSWEACEIWLEHQPKHSYILACLK